MNSAAKRIWIWKRLPLRLLILNLPGLLVGFLMLIMAVSSASKLSSELSVQTALATVLIFLVSAVCLYFSVASWLPSVVIVQVDKLSVRNLSSIALTGRAHRDVSANAEISLDGSLRLSAARDPLFRGTHLFVEEEVSEGKWHPFPVCSHAANAKGVLEKINKTLAAQGRRPLALKIGKGVR
ncbi:MAG: hypothetical protein KF767_03080 [Bdellovibrionaceae bacterium]|nr:hypothetical protein [Pseudobdellovibrionaceae bacterium]